MSKLLAGLALAGLLVCCGGKTEEDPGGTGGSAPGAPAEFTSCQASAECIVTSLSCCGTCGTATRTDATALHRDFVDEYRRNVCGMGTGCSRCYQPPDPTLLGTCSASVCTVLDLLEHASTACATDADCHLRAQACCECGADTSPGTLVAVSDGAAYGALVCDTDQGCDDCIAQYPADVTARCIERHCHVEDPRVF